MSMTQRLRALQRVLDLVCRLDRTTYQWLLWRLNGEALRMGFTLYPPRIASEGDEL